MFSHPPRHVKIHSSIHSPRSVSCWRYLGFAKTFSDYQYCNQKEQYSSSCGPTNYCIIWTFLRNRACLRWYVRSSRSFVKKERMKKNISNLNSNEKEMNEFQLISIFTYPFDEGFGCLRQACNMRVSIPRYRNVVKIVEHFLNLL